MSGPLSEDELAAAYAPRSGEALVEACYRVTRWTYVPSTPSKMLELAQDIAALGAALADEMADREAVEDVTIVDELELDPAGDDVATPRDLLTHIASLATPRE